MIKAHRQCDEPIILFKLKKTDLKKFPQALLKWFDRNKRKLPWRKNREPWLIMLSEFMLQQTRVDTVLPYFEEFTRRWPDVQSFAEASEDEVLAAWAGLGYYSRARNLQKAAKMIQEEFGGQFPSNSEDLRKLPGVGPYTAAAVASMAFGEAIPAIDGNLLRILSRLSSTPWQAGNNKDQKACAKLTQDLIPKDRPGDFNEAMMDLGASICLPRKPLCESCPIQEYCVAHKEGKEEAFPLKAEKKPPKEVDVYYLILKHGDQIYLRQRTERLLHAFHEYIPLKKKPEKTILCKLNGNNIHLPVQPHSEIKHIFSHRVWKIQLFQAELSDSLLCLEKNSHTLPQDPNELATLILKESNNDLAKSTASQEGIKLADFDLLPISDAQEELLPPFLRPFI